MRFLEKLPLPLEPEYRVAMSEEDLALLAIIFLAHLETRKEDDDNIAVAALQLADILTHVRGDDHRWFHKASHKLKKLCAKARR